MPLPPETPQHATAMRLAGTRMWRGKLFLFRDRIYLTGWIGLGKRYHRVISLRELDEVVWISLDETFNLVLRMGMEIVHLRVPNPAELKFLIEQAFPNVGRASPGLPRAKEKKQHLLVQKGHKHLKRLEPVSSRPQEDSSVPMPARKSAVSVEQLVGAEVLRCEVWRRDYVLLHIALSNGATTKLHLHGKAGLESALMSSPSRTESANASGDGMATSLPQPPSTEREN